MEEIRIGFAGIGKRGQELLKHVLLPQRECVAAVCDVYEDRAELGARLVCEGGQERPKVYTDYRQMLADGEINVVVIATAWESHVELALAAMRVNIAVAMEVGGAYTLKQCYELVQVYEETKTPFFFLENCCFGRREMMVRNMADQGVLGEIVHLCGGYHHDLRKEIAYGREERHYRLRNYLTRNCENYPTHELGPLAKVLKLNHGNRMLTLSSTASKAAGLNEYIRQNKPEDTYLQGSSFAQGDVVTTVIRCAGGETIVLTLDTTLPRYYSRGFTVRGTKGMYEEATDSIYLDCKEDQAHDFTWRRDCVGNAAAYEAAYEHPVWRQYLAQGIRGSHDGMDWLEFQLFFEALRKGEPMMVDVYDAASWMAVTALSEMSVARGGAVVDVPDFTGGRWHHTEPFGTSK